MAVGSDTQSSPWTFPYPQPHPNPDSNQARATHPNPHSNQARVTYYYSCSYRRSAQVGLRRRALLRRAGKPRQTAGGDGTAAEAGLLRTSAEWRGVGGQVEVASTDLSSVRTIYGLAHTIPCISFCSFALPKCVLVVVSDIRVRCAS